MTDTTQSIWKSKDEIISDLEAKLAVAEARCAELDTDAAARADHSEGGGMMSDLPRITETWHWDEGNYAAGEAPYMGRSKFGKWVTVEHAADIIVEYQQRLAAAVALLREAVEKYTEACVIASEDGKCSKEYGVAIVGSDWYEQAKEVCGDK